MSGIYLHIPFCKQACHYCNFHFSTSTKYMREMVDAMVKEIEMRKDFLEHPLESIYFGGGTPSLLDEEGLQKIFNAISKNFSFEDTAEITLEANPDDLNDEKLRYLAASPINRLSIGIQSFHEDELTWMNRAHNAKESKKCLEAAQTVGFGNLSIDLIYGLPHSTHELWIENMEYAVQLDIPHISMYALTVEPGTALNHWVQKGKEKEAEDQYVVDQFNLGMDFLGEKGYEHYEISNYALPGQYAIHNSNYWKSKPYLGIGPSAHSFDGHSRFMNIAHNMKYMSAIAENELMYEKEHINEKMKYNEYVMTRLRTSWGIQLEDLGEFRAHFLESIELLKKRNWVIENEGHYKLSREGKHFADAAAAELFI